MMGILGLALVLAGVWGMAWSRRVSRAGDPDSTAPLGLVLFLVGCVVVGVGAVLITEWWLET